MALSHRRISPKELRAQGWEPAKRHKSHLFGRDFTHKDGWKITHCGHPTALWPYILQTPDGRMILTGAAGPLRRADFGTAWPTVASAVDYVASLQEVLP